jgi:hypothetical protein
MPKLLKKVVFSLFTALVLLVAVGFTQAPVRAQAKPWYNPDLGQFILTVFDEGNSEIFGERYTYAQVVWITHSLTAIAAGEDLDRCIAAFKGKEAIDLGKCIKEAAEQGSSGTVSVLAALGDSALRTRPASGVAYVASVAGNLHLIPEAQAQTGFGFRTLEPIQTIWKVTRNMAYLFSIFALIAMAFMIMFRVRLSPQTVITIQSAIPRITIALILITFSYAIAGFIIDLAYVATGLMAVLIKSANPTISNLSLIELFKTLNGSGQPLGAIFLGIMLVAILATIAGGLLAAVFTSIGGVAVGMIILLVFTVFILFFLLRLLWLMFRTLVTIILLVIGGPIIILLGVFPGIGGFSKWIRNLIAQIAVFTVIVALLFLAHYFFWQFTLGPLSNTDLFGSIKTSDFQALFNPYQINYGTEGNAGLVSLPGSLGVEKSSPLFGIVISFVILGIIPSAGNLIRSLLQGQPFDVKGALGTTYGAPLGVGTGLIGGLRAAQIEELEIAAKAAEAQQQYAKAAQLRRQAAQARQRGNITGALTGLFR